MTEIDFYDSMVKNFDKLNRNLELLIRAVKTSNFLQNQKIEDDYLRNRDDL